MCDNVVQGVSMFAHLSSITLSNGRSLFDREIDASPEAVAALNTAMMDCQMHKSPAIKDFLSTLNYMFAKDIADTSEGKIQLTPEGFWFSRKIGNTYAPGKIISNDEVLAGLSHKIVDAHTQMQHDTEYEHDWQKVDLTNKALNGLGLQATVMNHVNGMDSTYDLPTVAQKVKESANERVAAQRAAGGSAGGNVGGSLGGRP